MHVISSLALVNSLVPFSKQMIVLYCYKIPEKTKINPQLDNPKGYVHVHLTESTFDTLYI